MTAPPQRVAIIGGGWAGLAAAVAAVEAGHAVHVFEASRRWGGRARTWPLDHATEGALVLDNGQHILIGAYTHTLALMRQIGVEPQQVLKRLPLALRFPDGSGLQVPRWATRWPAPLDLLAAILSTGTWTWSDRWSLLRASLAWRARGFKCDPHLSVAQLCFGLPDAVVHDLIDPLCVSALNTPMPKASARVFLRVLRDALFGPGAPGYRGADLLLPCTDLGHLVPEPAVRWLQAHGAHLYSGHRIARLHTDGSGWRVDDTPFDQVILACPPNEAVRLLQDNGLDCAHASTAPWMAHARSLRFEAIATVYARTPAPLDWKGRPAMLALKAGPAEPAQFVFNREQLTGESGLLAFVVSASPDIRVDELEAQVLAQGCRQLALPHLRALKTVIEKRATFACVPGLTRPSMAIAPGLWAAGDYVEGPYPATLEGAVRSGQQAAAAVTRCATPPGRPGGPDGPGNA